MYFPRGRFPIQDNGELYDLKDPLPVRNWDW